MSGHDRGEINQCLCKTIAPDSCPWRGSELGNIRQRAVAAPKPHLQRCVERWQISRSLKSLTLNCWTKEHAPSRASSHQLASRRLIRLNAPQLPSQDNAGLPEVHGRGSAPAKKVSTTLSPALHSLQRTWATMDALIRLTSTSRKCDKVGKWRPEDTCCRHDLSHRKLLLPFV